MIDPKPRSAAGSQWGDAPEHAVLPHPHSSYDIVALRIECDPADGSEPFLDLTVRIRRGTERRVLRFWSPQDLEVERGAPYPTGGFQIQDISSRGLDGLGVRVCDCEATRGAVSFVPRCVEGIGQELA